MKYSDSRYFKVISILLCFAMIMLMIGCHKKNLDKDTDASSENSTSGNVVLQAPTSETHFEMHTSVAISVNLSEETDSETTTAESSEIESSVNDSVPSKSIEEPKITPADDSKKTPTPSNTGNATNPTESKMPTMVPTNTPANTVTPTDTPTPTNTPIPKDTPTPTTPPKATNSYAQEVLSLVNAERAKVGVAPLVLDSTLNEATRIRAKEIVDTTSHQRPNGDYFYTVLDEVGASYTDFGENIAFGQASADEVVAAWMSSDGHRANMLNPYYVKMGLGSFFTEDSQFCYYWVQIFTD